MRLIDADALLRIFNPMEWDCTKIDASTVVGEIRTAPTIEAAPVVHGRWIPIHEYENKRCSVCRTVFSDFTLGYYCAHCGARMDGDGNA